MPMIEQEGRGPRCHLVWEQRDRLGQPHATCAMLFGQGLPQTDSVCELPHASRCSRLFLKPPRTGIAPALH